MRTHEDRWWQPGALEGDGGAPCIWPEAFPSKCLLGGMIYLRSGLPYDSWGV